MRAQAIRLGLICSAVLLLAACAAGVNGMPEPRAASEQSLAGGRRLIASYGCGACHTIPGVAGAHGKAAPPLANFFERSTIAGRLPNTTENLVKWLQDPQQIAPGTVMPNLGVSEEAARTIAAYLYHRPTIFDFLRE